LNYYMIIISRFLKSQTVFVSLMSFLVLLLLYKLTWPVFILDSFSYTVNTGLEFDDLKTVNINITEKLFNIFKILYIITTCISIVSITNGIYERFLKTLFKRQHKIKWYDIKNPAYSYSPEKLELILGLSHNDDNTELNLRPKYEKITGDGLFQNIIATGTIGTGKTICFITVVALQLIYYKFNDPDKKAACLFLDVKGNFHQFIHAFAYECGRKNDVITIELGGKWKYNPLHKPELSEIELANRCRYILELFATSSQDSFWIDKGEDTITELLKLIRLYNNGYVNFEELHYMATKKQYRDSKIMYLKKLYENDKLNKCQTYAFETARDFFLNEFDNFEYKVQQFIISEITRITQPFISTKEVRDAFSPTREEINFYGFEDVIKQGKIVVWKINANKQPKVAKLISAYLKLDFQKEIMISLDKKKSDPVSAERIKVTICDEYQEYCTKNDAEFLSQSREPRSITIAATQSYSSIIRAFSSERDPEVTARMLFQSFVNKVWLRCDDDYTIQKVMRQVAKEDRGKVSRLVTEQSRGSHVSYSLEKIIGTGKNLSSGTNISVQKEYRFDEKFLGQDLELGQAVCLLSDGKKIIRPKVVHLSKLFEGRILCQAFSISSILTLPNTGRQIQDYCKD